MDTKRTIVLITGANSGLGFEIAVQLLADTSTHVLLGCRSGEKGQAAIRDLRSRQLPGDVELLNLDVANEESISTAAKQVETTHGRLDILINNAAIGWPTGTMGEQMAQSFQTNAASAFLMGEAFIELLKKSQSPRIINVSSGAGSIGRRLDPSTPSHNMGFYGMPYCVSKAAMNYITAAQSVEYGKLGVKVFAYNPGFIVSNLGPQNNAESGAQPASVGAAPVVSIVNGERDDEHGEFLSVKGKYPW